ncbi:MAG TPA: hypothetical protein VJG49_04280 [Candidatus Nanoarchaeia archaeon]|nr:hypothetical protein [Candidatus Nanoarchaeia archaeon]
MSECNETHIGIAIVAATPKIAYAPVAMGEDYALRASRGLGAPPPVSRLQGPTIIEMYTSRAPVELSPVMYSPAGQPHFHRTNYNSGSSCGYQ